jgi:hypothetical protein
MDILGYNYTIDNSKPLSEMDGNVGFCNFDQKLIRVANDVDFDVRLSTLLHEVLEAINYHLEVGISEAQIKQLEVGLHTLVSGAILHAAMYDKE